MESYRDLAELIYKDDPEMRIIIPLGPGDEELEDQIYDLNFPRNCFIIKEKLDQIPRVLAESKLYIGNDTGLKHISIAVGVKTLSFFGPEPPTEWHPYSNKEHPYYFKDELECRTRKAHYCGLSVCDSMICLSGFTPTDVFQDYLKVI